MHVATEEAIIIWDAPAKTQHFIRRASFESNGKDFGFLVPTPTQPQLAEADDQAFAILAELTAPAVNYGMAKPADMSKSIPVPKAEVEVLERKKVAGLDAAVLEATRAEALDTWLKTNGYVSGPELLEWYRPYIAERWKITAFKIDTAGRRSTTSAAVRMSFQTERPFFPYREPANQRSSEAGRRDRLLRVFVLAPERVEGSIGADGAWPAKAVWSNRIEESDFKKVLTHARLKETPPILWLTEFEDRAAPRPGTDEVFFRRARDQSTVKRPDISYGIGLDTLIFGALILVGLLWVAYKIPGWIYRAVKGGKRG